ncbi:uncharacterized protein LOC131166761 [Malania oleifera]|uniref:uncharacterized protein LOC131166761 n=1 Tax=Malania oleifera TaxID=397392 RepID=UPI0025ADA26D|nr:uncharacterized protein LOC131166761 [Malania oleifera]
MVLDEARKAWKFEKGLKKKIQKQTEILQIQDFATLVDKATMVEESLQEDTEVQILRKRPVPPSYYSVERIKAAQKEEAELVKVMEGVQDGLKPDFNISNDGILRFHTKICVPNDAEIKRVILKKAHRLLYTVHPGSTKMYMDLRESFL